MSAGGSDDGEEGGFELNLAPIIDCFTVLITYLLVSASFLSLSMLEVATPQLPSSAEPMPPPSNKPISLTLMVTERHAVQLSLTGPVEKQWTIAATQVGVDTEALLKALRSAQALVQSLKDITIKAEKLVPYRDVAKAIEKAKIVFPSVFVGDL